ncbi:MAG: hypothetical protein EOP50_12620 [Sphingobacteriales bacterium]|nr:MAG: hypothetical protein EOP50_12620 [Sphingobacteriales bacterium]
MALKIFVARQKNERLKTLGVVWVNLVLCTATLLATVSTYLGISKGIPVTGLLFSVWLLSGGIFYVSVRHPYKTLDYRLHMPVALICLASLVAGIALVKSGVAI